MDTGHGPEEYSFLQEVIKDEQKDLKKIVKKIGQWAILGLILGITVYTGFMALKLWAEKREAELMPNGGNVPYIGIVGTTVTVEMSEIQGIPVGLYVTEVEVDSPAMKAGIQSGDVITKVGGSGVSTLEAYHKAVLEQEAGKTITLHGQRRGAENYVDIKFSVTVGVEQ